MSDYIVILISKSKACFYNLLKIGNYADYKILDRISNTNYDMQMKAKKKKVSKNKEKVGKVKSDNDEEYIDKITNKLVQEFIENNSISFKRIILAGPNKIKGRIKDHSSLSRYLNQYEFDLVNTPPINDKTLWILHDNYFTFSENEEHDTENLIAILKKMMDNGDSKLVFGEKEIIEGMKDYMVSKVLMSTSVNYEVKKSICNNNRCSCKLILTPKDNLKDLGVDIVGIKYY